MSLLPRDDSLAISDRKQIDKICLAYEDEWLAGRRPVLEAYLRLADAAQQSILLKELLLLELDYRRSIRDEPDLDDYLARFAPWTASVRAAFSEADLRPVLPRYLPGSLIGRHRVRRKLGAGAFASVYLAWDAQLQRDVAVKVPHPARLDDVHARQRFLEEARAIARLEHPRIVAVYDASELADGTVVLVMQYVAGPSLRQTLDAGPMPVAQACNLLADVADAVDAAHHAGVIHRDLKPSNMLLDESLQPHVCDFGLALQESRQHECRGECAGTLAYMAPEQLRGEAHQLDGRADIWAVGVVLYEALTGRQPFQGRDRQELTEEILARDPRPPRQIDRRIGKSVESVCLRCLEKRPAHRYPTAADLADDLRRVARRPLPSRRGWLYGSVVLGILLLGWLATVYHGPSLDGSARVDRIPFRGTLDLMIWNPQDAHRQGVQLGDDQAVPLRTGDRVRLAVELSRPAYAYVVWMDVAGVPAPVYPWRQGDWANLPQAASADVTLALPEEAEAGWLVRTPRDGMETLLLLVRRTPLPAEIPLRDLLANLPKISLPTRPNAMWFQGGRLLPTEGLVGRTPGQAANRDPVLGQTVTIQDPLLQLQRMLVERLSPHFELIRAVSFPVRGD
ncbi:MAG: serine/threonine protein kinase [Pirellulaceae bacterium]